MYLATVGLLWIALAGLIAVLVCEGASRGRQAEADEDRMTDDWRRRGFDKEPR